jgi:replicative DNA helicase
MGLRGQVVTHSDIEGDILTAMIVSTGFLHETVSMYRNEYFSDYARIIGKWVLEYYLQYRQAPGRNIETIYNSEKNNIKPALATNVGTFLTNLSTKYEDLETFNMPYMVDESRAYYRKQAYTQLFEQGRGMLMLGKTEEVEQLMEDFRGVARATSKWENPFDPVVINMHYAAKEERAYDVLTFRGHLGNLVGILKRGWLMAFMGPMKRGKSFWEQETCFCAAAQKRRVAYINLEMNDPTIRDREYTRLTGLPETPGIYIIPVFDCYHNQVGGCPVPQNQIKGGQTAYGGALYGVDDEKPTYNPENNSQYKTCTNCRLDKTYNKYYIPEVWYTNRNYESSPDGGLVAKRAGQFIKQYGDRFRQITYPAYSANLLDVSRALDELQYTEGFTADIVVIDYADILAPSMASLKGREALDDIWKGMKRMAAERNCLVVTASQSTRKSITKQSIHQTDAAEDIRKVAHADAMFGLNQTEMEKIGNHMRVNMLVHRHKKPSAKEVMVLQQFGLGMTYLDSAYWYTQYNN